MSGIIWRAGRDEWRRVRDDYQLHLEAQYAAAIEHTNGVLLNKRGKDAGISPFSLFKGPESRVRAYASEELRGFWHRHPRVTFEAFERGYYAMAGELELPSVWVSDGS